MCMYVNIATVASGVMTGRLNPLLFQSLRRTAVTRPGQWKLCTVEIQVGGTGDLALHNKLLEVARAIDVSVRTVLLCPRTNRTYTIRPSGPPRCIGSNSD